ncbi:lipopolysaccharide transport periplasmic protein LptA [Hydrocarboniphaga effusa]|jgi:lipopolysaccharide export system protein LptA|uniref:lipopolysaccharide transport periplasmic protein LptA n=1 Tax=Hydrocarboniphaga effusa TaxID=243629 RepID=UPI0031381BFB
MCPNPNPVKDRAEARIVAGLLAALMLGSPLAALAQASPAKPADKSTEPAAKPKAEKKSNETAERLRPTGPVTITAKNVDWAQNGLMVYSGDVKLVSDTLKIEGDKLELEQLGDGQYRAKVFGNPANLRHDAAPGSTEKPEPPVTARGKTLVYDTKAGLIDVTGNARVTRGEDELTSETIHYNVNQRRIQADGGSGGPVKIIIQPQPRGGAAPSTKPDTKPTAP